MMSHCDFLCKSVHVCSQTVGRKPSAGDAQMAVFQFRTSKMHNYGWSAFCDSKQKRCELDEVVSTGRTGIYYLVSLFIKEVL
jgi:hypothetical protein